MPDFPLPRGEPANGCRICMTILAGELSRLSRLGFMWRPGDTPDPQRIRHRIGTQLLGVARNPKNPVAGQAELHPVRTIGEIKSKTHEKNPPLRGERSRGIIAEAWRERIVAMYTLSRGTGMVSPDAR